MQKQTKETIYIIIGLIIYSLGFYLFINSFDSNENTEKEVVVKYYENHTKEEIDNIEIAKDETLGESLEKFYNLAFEVKTIRTEEISEDQIMYDKNFNLDIPGTVYLLKSEIDENYNKPLNYSSLTPEIVAKNLTKDLGYISSEIYFAEKILGGTNIITIIPADKSGKYRFISFSDYYETEELENCEETSSPGGSSCQKITDIVLHIFVSDPLDIPVNNRLDFDKI